MVSCHLIRVTFINMKRVGRLVAQEVGSIRRSWNQWTDGREFYHFIGVSKRCTGQANWTLKIIYQISEHACIVQKLEVRNA